MCRSDIVFLVDETICFEISVLVGLSAWQELLISERASSSKYLKSIAPPAFKQGVQQESGIVTWKPPYFSPNHQNVVYQSSTLLGHQQFVIEQQIQRPLPSYQLEQTWKANNQHYNKDSSNASFNIMNTYINVVEMSQLAPSLLQSSTTASESLMLVQSAAISVLFLPEICILCNLARHLNRRFFLIGLKFLFRATIVCFLPLSDGLPLSVLLTASPASVLSAVESSNQVSRHHISLGVISLLHYQIPSTLYIIG